MTALTLPNVTVLFVALFSASAWCALADEMRRQAHTGSSSRWHAVVAWALAIVSALLPLAALGGICAR